MRSTVPFTFCGSNEILDSNLSNKKKPMSFHVLFGPCFRQVDAFWLSSDIVKLLCSPSVVLYTLLKFGN